MGQIAERHAQWLEGRGIDLETATRCGLYTDQQNGNGNVLVFPFLEHGSIVNRKYRGPQKRFWQDKDGKKTFWNADVLDDPALGDGQLIITEGEMDAASAIQSGHPLTVSVPDGAPAKRSEEPIDPENDTKFSYIHTNWERLKKVKRIILAVDNDDAGKALAHELSRRLGAVRCKFVTYPEGCKDLNDVLMKHGEGAVSNVLTGAKPYPVKGLYRLSEFPEMEEPVTYSTGYEQLDRHFRPFTGGFVVWTGVPGHGKTSFVNRAAFNLADLHNFNIGIASFENPPVPHLRNALRRMYCGGYSPHETDRIAEADRWIEERFFFIGSNPREEEDEIDLEWLIDKAEDAVIRFGISFLIIDPWNEIEHKRRRDETETEYTGRAIRALKRFARSYDCGVWVVAHPYKMGGGKDGIRKPNLYDIAGSANWFNKCDHGLVVDRSNIEGNQVEVDVKKSRFSAAGKPGSVMFAFLEDRERFNEVPPELKNL